MSTDGREGLSIGYRIGWRLRYLAMSVFGPARSIRIGVDYDTSSRWCSSKMSRARTAAIPTVRNRTPATPHNTDWCPNYWGMLSS